MFSVYFIQYFTHLYMLYYRFQKRIKKGEIPPLFDL